MVTLCAARRRPAPEQSPQGVSIFWPSPPQAEQDWVMAKNPWENWTRPVPPQVAQRLSPVPRLAPVPSQPSQDSTRS